MIKTYVISLSPTMSSSAPPFKIEEPNVVRAAGPDTTLIPTANLPAFMEDVTLTCPYAEIHWFNLEKCPSANGFVYLLQVNATLDVVAPSYPFEMSTPSLNMMLSTDIVTGNLTIGNADSSFNATQFISIQQRLPSFVAFTLTPGEVLPISSAPIALSLNLNFF